MADIFWLNKADFQPVAKVRNAADMTEALKHAPKQVIAHHITKSKNDFVNWARNGLKDQDLAAKLSAIRHDDPQALEKVIAAFASKSGFLAQVPSGPQQQPQPFKKR